MQQSRNDMVLIETLPLHERRYIRVISDRAFQKKSEALKAQIGNTAKSSSSNLSSAIMLAAPLVPGGAVARVAVMIAGMAYEVYTSLPSKNGADAEEDALIIDIPVSSTANFSFPVGIAEIGQVYAANPLRDRDYFSIATYNDDLMMHKLSELEIILNSLRAKRYMIDYHESHNALTSAEAKLTVKHIGGGGGMEAETGQKLRFKRAGTSEGGEPTLPGNLLWYPREPVWQALADSRLNYGRKEFSFSIELENSLKVSAQAALNATVLTGEASATFNRSKNILLTVEGTF